MDTQTRAARQLGLKSVIEKGIELKQKSLLRFYYRATVLSAMLYYFYSHLTEEEAEAQQVTLFV